jgi:hypothetical protein
MIVTGPMQFAVATADCIASCSRAQVLRVNLIRNKTSIKALHGESQLSKTVFSQPVHG